MSDMRSISTRRRARGESQKSIAPYQSARKSRRQTMNADVERIRESLGGRR